MIVRGRTIINNKEILRIEFYSAKYPKAMECLLKDKAEMLAFYDFPAEHWTHIRTTNPIESAFATVRGPILRFVSQGATLSNLH